VDELVIFARLYMSLCKSHSMTELLRLRKIYGTPPLACRMMNSVLSFYFRLAVISTSG
jgi:hypothetical protein